MKDVIDYEDLFSISITGELFSKRSNRFLKKTVGSNGYYTIATKIGGRSGKDICFKLHRLVAKAYIPNPLNLPEVNHKDGNKLNNNLDNLEWVSHKDNMAHASTLGLTNYMPRDNRVASTSYSKCILTENNVSEICSLYNEGFTQEAIAESFSISRSAIYHILRKHNRG